MSKITDQEIVDCLARHGIGWGNEHGVTAYPLDGEDAPVYIGAVRELLAAPVAPAQEPASGYDCEIFGHAVTDRCRDCACRAQGERQPETWKVLPSSAGPDLIRELLAVHAEMREANSYCYFELAYTRRRNWMAFICDKPAGGTIGTPEFGEGRKILAQGQGNTPDRACKNALRSIEERSKPTGELKQEAKE